ncbi:MAG: tetratricopeptide repeat protein [Pseudomonadota bacterium]
MRLVILPICLSCLMALPGQADTCPPPLEYADRKATLLEMLQSTRDANAGRFLSRELLSLLATAPNRKAQAALDDGMALRRGGDLDEARAVFDELVAYCPDYAEGYNQRAFVWFLQGDYDAALRDLDAALVHAPDHAGAMAGKAITLLELDRTEEAHSVLRDALTLNPWLPERDMLHAPPPGTAV